MLGGSTSGMVYLKRRLILQLGGWLDLIARSLPTGAIRFSLILGYGYASIACPFLNDILTTFGIVAAIVRRDNAAVLSEYSAAGACSSAREFLAWALCAACPHHRRVRQACQ
jgi:hypothetical protein